MESGCRGMWVQGVLSPSVPSAAATWTMNSMRPSSVVRAQSADGCQDGRQTRGLAPTMCSRHRALAGHDGGRRRSGQPMHGTASHGPKVRAAVVAGSRVAGSRKGRHVLE